MSLRWRLAILVAAALAAAACASVAAVRIATAREFKGLVSVSDRRRAESLAPVLAEAWAERGSWDGVRGVAGAGAMRMGGMQGEGRMRQGARAAMAWAGPRILLLDADGVAVVDTRGLAVGSRNPATNAAAGVPVEAGGARVGTLFVGSMVDGGLEPADAGFLSSVTRAIVLATALAALMVLGAAILAAGRVARPIEQVTRAAEAAAGGDLDVRVAVSGGGETGRLADAFNRMTGSLRGLEADRRRMIADAAHELRTPASLIQGAVEAMLDGVYPASPETLRDLHAETLRLSSLVSDLDDLSLLEAGRMTMERAPVDLGAVVESEVGRFAARAREAGIELRRAVHGLPAVQGDARRLGQVAANLLSNALRHAPPGGVVDASVRRDGGSVELRVEDSGPGIPPRERARVFERYYRVDGARSQAAGGRGLGLTIAAGIVSAHGGAIRAEESRLGGAALVVTLPAAGSEPG
jgi:two-component system, OmpR family, sensor histidine kinase BaeS